MSVLKYLIIFLLLASCAVPKTYDLSTYPSQYDIQETTNNYRIVTDVNMEYYALVSVYNKLRELEVETTEQQEQEIIENLDKYIYWIAITTVHLYQHKFDEARKSAGKAREGLKGFKTVLGQLVKMKST